VILDSQSADCFVEIWISDSPSKKDRFAQRFTLRPGVSATLPARVRGNYLWFVIRGKGRWAYEMATALIEPGGVRRPTRVP
jgi:mannose-6-phosphate isomerase-like protein (cupin superfamily)